MKNAIPLVVTWLFLVPLAACETPPEPDPAPLAPAATAEPAELPPEVAVPEADILKAAEIYKALHDDGLDEAQQQDRAAALMTNAGWSEDRYSALMFDISAHPASREAYLKAIE